MPPGDTSVASVVVERAPHPTKQQLRHGLIANRVARSVDERRAAGQPLCDRVLALPEVEGAATVACYVSTPQEPSTSELVAALSARNRTVLLPLLRPDFNVDWAVYEPGALTSGRLGISEPAGGPLGVAAIETSSVVVCPGLAADRLGQRLGRGGGSYDRVLARVGAEALRVVLLYDDEVLAVVPNDPHDEPVDVIVTPRRTLRTRLPTGA